MIRQLPLSFFFFFNDTATTEIYTLSLHDALPIWAVQVDDLLQGLGLHVLHDDPRPAVDRHGVRERSEEHTSELQSPDHLVCRLLLEKKKKIQDKKNSHHKIHYIHGLEDSRHQSDV